MRVIYELSVDDVLAIFAESVGTGGVRDRGALESAVAAPFQTFGGQYLHEGVFAMGAALMRSLSQNQPFVDGNKRVAWVSTVAFFSANGVNVQASVDEVKTAMVGLAMHSISLEELAAFLEARSTAFRVEEVAPRP